MSVAVESVPGNSDRSFSHLIRFSFFFRIDAKQPQSFFFYTVKPESVAFENRIPIIHFKGSFDLFRSFYHFYRCRDPDLFHSSRLGKSLPQFFDAVFKNQFLQI